MNRNVLLIAPVLETFIGYSALLSKETNELQRMSKGQTVEIIRKISKVEDVTVWAKWKQQYMAKVKVSKNINSDVETEGADTH